MLTPSPAVGEENARASLSLLIPAASTASSAHRHPAYVSPATNSLTFSQDGGAPHAISLAAGSASCTAAPGGRSCTVDIGATAGTNQTFTLKLFASTDGSGSPLAAQTIVASIVAGKANPINAVLNGVVVSLSVQLENTTLQYGEPGSINLVVNGLDASGNTIVGPGVFAAASGKPIVVHLSVNEPSSMVTLASTIVTQPTTASVKYNGGATTSALITAATGSLKSSATLLFQCGPPASGTALYVTNDNSAGFEAFPLNGATIETPSVSRVNESSTPFATLRVDATASSTSGPVFLT